MFQGLTDAVVQAFEQYGYLAFFAFLFLESSMLFPVVPSEVAVPAAAALLVDGPLSFGLFVAAGTLGATVGSVFLYNLFATLGLEAVERYGSYVRVSEQRVHQGRDWFHRWGESSVLWGRILPVLRSLVSIPAGIAEMDVRKFTAYSAVGSLLFNVGVGATVYYGKEALPHQLILDQAGAALSTVASSPPLAVLTVGALLALGAVGWWVYGRIDLPV